MIKARLKKCTYMIFRVDNQNMRNVLRVLSKDDSPVSKEALKFKEAAQYGEARKNVAKCEHRYKCSLTMDIIQLFF